MRGETTWRPVDQHRAPRQDRALPTADAILDGPLRMQSNRAAVHVESGDFASAAMMRLVAAGLAHQGIAIPLPTSTGARVPHSLKRGVLHEVFSAHGPGAILGIADAAPHMPPEPVVQALLCAPDIDDLLARWHRLERFSHARHTIEVGRIGGNRMRLLHRARDAGPSPSVAESLLVIGLLTILAELVGPADVMLSTEAGNVWREHGRWRPIAEGDVGPMILTATPASIIASRPGNDVHDNSLEIVRNRLTADPVRRWTVENLSGALDMAPRTFQRILARQGLTFSRLVAEARLQVAASHLCSASTSGLAEIGFLAGYSDQAHFSRSFQRAVGTTPKAYRVAFGRRPLSAAEGRRPR